MAGTDTPNDDRLTRPEEPDPWAHRRSKSGRVDKTTRIFVMMGLLHSSGNAPSHQSLYTYAQQMHVSPRQMWRDVAEARGAILEATATRAALDETIRLDINNLVNRAYELVRMPAEVSNARIGAERVLQSAVAMRIKALGWAPTVDADLPEHIKELLR